MNIFVFIGIMLAVLVGLAVAIDMRGRRSGGVNQNQIDADKANSFTSTSKPDGPTMGGPLP